MPVKKSSAAMLALGRCDTVAPGRDGRRIVGGRVVVGDGAADGAAVADLRVADEVGEAGEGGDLRLHTSASAATAACGVMPPTTRPASSRMPQVLDAAEVDDVGGLGQALLQVGIRVMAAGHDLGVAVAW
jgi:hypothetical protein